MRTTITSRPCCRCRSAAAGQSIRRRGGRAAMTLVKAGSLGQPADRLLDAVAARGHDVFVSPDALPACEDDVTLVVSDGPTVFDLAGLAASLGGRRFRVLMLSRLGVHPDARAASLQRLWRL